MRCGQLWRWRLDGRGDVAAAVGAEDALLWGAEGAAAVAGEGGVGGAFHLKRLHAREEVEQLRGERVGVEAGGREGEQEFVRGLERGEAAILGLLLDEETARGGGREHHAREVLQARTEAKHFAGAAPRAVEEKENEAAATKLGGGEGTGGEVARGGARVDEHGEVGGIGDERLHGFVGVEVDAHVDLAVGEAKVGEAAGAGFLVLEFLRMHEEHKPRARGHRRDGRAPAEGLRPEAAVAGEATHSMGARLRGEGLGAKRKARGESGKRDACGRSVAIGRAGLHDCGRCLWMKRINR